jgi:pilus biogenesis lipoprotein CpaD
MKTVSTLGLVAALASAALLSGCLGTNERHFGIVEAPNEPRVDLVRLEHPVLFAPGGANISVDESRALDNFLQRNEIGFGDEVAVSVLGSEDQLARRRAFKVATQLEESDLKPLAGPPRENLGGLNQPAVLVTVNRYVVTPPICPNMGHPNSHNVKNTQSADANCAQNYNLSMMVANPRDLFRGAEMGPQDGARAALGVERHRIDEEKELPTVGLDTIERQVIE